MKTRFRIEGAEVVLEIPPAGFSLGALSSLVPAFLFPAFVLIAFQGFIRELAKEPDTFNIAFAAFFALFGLVLPICVGVRLFLRAIAQHHTVRASADRLHVTTAALSCRALLKSRLTNSKNCASPSPNMTITRRRRPRSWLAATAR